MLIFSRRRIAPLVAGVPGAIYTRHSSYFRAQVAFRDALRLGITCRIPIRVPEIIDVDEEIIDLSSDTESKSDSDDE